MNNDGRNTDDFCVSGILGKSDPEFISLGAALKKMQMQKKNIS